MRTVCEVGYTIVALDRDEFELRRRDDWTNNQRDACKEAQDMIRDPDLLAAGLYTVQVLDPGGACIWDDFVW